MQSLEELCREAEFFETEQWAAEAIFDVELLTPFVIDAGCGRGMLARAAEKRGYNVLQIDKTDWEQHGFDCHESKCGKHIGDFLTYQNDKITPGSLTAMMNPPFSLAHLFVQKAFEIGARKVLCFQRLAWRESEDRRAFWEKYPPTRTYVCGNRATCWRGDLIDPAARIKPDGKEMSTAPTAHAWFVWERGQPLNGLGALYRNPDSVKDLL